MGSMLHLLFLLSVLYYSSGWKPEYDNLARNSSVGVNFSKVLNTLETNVEYSVEDFKDYSQDEPEAKYSPDLPKSRKPRGINRVFTWVGRGFNKVFNSPYIYNFYPLINYSVGKIMQHLPFLGNSPSAPSGPPSPDYAQTAPQTNPQQVQQQKMQQEYEEEMEKKQQQMQQKQEEEEAKTQKAAEERKLINERAKKLAAKYVQLYFAKQSSATFKVSPSFVRGEYPGQPVYNNPVYDQAYQAYPQANYPAAYPSVDNMADSVPVAPDVYPAVPPVDPYPAAALAPADVYPAAPLVPEPYPPPPPPADTYLNA